MRVRAIMGEMTYVWSWRFRDGVPVRAWAFVPGRHPNQRTIRQVT